MKKIQYLYIKIDQSERLLDTDNSKSRVKTKDKISRGENKSPVRTKPQDRSVSD
ncbi:MAG: hypothetical protein ACFE95_15145 [Candidatus Hodarchaeota archaeon]